MNGRTIIRAILISRYRRTFCLPNYTPHNWWECDVFEMTKAGYFREFEVKISRADFFADAGKEWEFGSWSTGYKTARKHDLLAAGDPRGPAAFYYVTPPGLIASTELPLWAGLIEIHALNDRHGPRFLEKEIQAAPRLHNQKAADGVRKHAMSVCYWRMHGLVNRQAA